VFLALGAAVIVALLASVAVGRVLARNIVRPITRLRDEADEVASDRLPAAVAATAEGGEPPPVEPIDVGSDDEVGELADSFNEVQRTAIGLAADQALLRRNFSDLFVYLGRRNQNLLGRQLELIDDLERDEEDPDLLGSMFRLDHLATRMRRNAESLLVIAGQEPTRTWAEPVAIRDVVRAASSEVEDYVRVRLGPITDIRIRGEAVSDIAHLLAELLENGLRHSPAPAPVTVCGQPYSGGAYAISVSDQGLGLSEEEIEAINRRMSTTPEHDPAEDIPTSSLGLFVVSRLARRHGCRVRLTGQDRGVVAWVLLPSQLLAPTAEDQFASPAPSTTDPDAAARSAPEVAAPAPSASAITPPAARRPATVAEALTLRPIDPDQPIVVTEPEGRETAGSARVREPQSSTPSRTPSGLTRRVSRARHTDAADPETSGAADPETSGAADPETSGAADPETSGAADPETSDAAEASTPPPRRQSAQDFGRGLRSFQQAVERGRSETQSGPVGEPS
jgi:signal transduction histidine kinase